jgi:aryl-alcohol dehydrogenase-like predicted oxidoreductase
MSIPGHATIEGTEEFARKFHQNYADSAYNRLGKTQKLVSQVGFGTYRCHVDVTQHKEALKLALDKGCNLVDTSANYGDGNAEVLIGEVLNDEIVWGDIKRENVVVVSKAGYIQGENMEIARERERKGQPFPEVVKYQSELWHCIHPQFLEDQITRSLARMHLDTLDVYLLHNPEYFLSNAARLRSFDAEKTRKEFYERIRRAFVKMEKLADEGLIRWYGISSNGFPISPDSPDCVSLARVWEAYEAACQEIGKPPAEGRFAVIQLPFNWVEHQAATLPNNEYRGQQYTVLQLAQKLSLGVLVNRPLNAIYDNRLFLRLARYGFKEGVDYRAQFEGELQTLEELEEIIQQNIREWKIEVEVHENILSDFFQNSAKLQHLSLQAADVSQFNQVTAYYIAPLVGLGCKTFIKQVPAAEKEAAQSLVNRYFEQYTKVTDAWLNYLDGQNYQQIKPLEEKFNKTYSKLAAKLTLSQKALLLAAEVTGVDVVLNGMRTPEYVTDSMEIMKTKADISPEELLKSY